MMALGLSVGTVVRARSRVFAFGESMRCFLLGTVVRARSRVCLLGSGFARWGLVGVGVVLCVSAVVACCVSAGFLILRKGGCC